MRERERITEREREREKERISDFKFVRVARQSHLNYFVLQIKSIIEPYLLKLDLM